MACRADWSGKFVESSINPNVRKTLIPPIRKDDANPGSGWLDLHQAAVVELTSEADAYPIEGALSRDGQRGWRAGMPGVQTVRLLFDEPQTIQRIRLVFREEEIARTQEFGLRCSVGSCPVSVWRSAKPIWNASYRTSLTVSMSARCSSVRSRWRCASRGPAAAIFVPLLCRRLISAAIARKSKPCCWGCWLPADLSMRPRMPYRKWASPARSRIWIRWRPG